MKKCLPCPCHMGSQVWDTEYSWDRAARVSQPFLKKNIQIRQGHGSDTFGIREGYSRDTGLQKIRKKKIMPETVHFEGRTA